MTLVGDQFAQNDYQNDYIEPQGVNPAEYWKKPGSGAETTRLEQQKLEQINDRFQLVATSDQTGFSLNSARYLPGFDQGAFNYYAPTAISSDATGYGAALNGFKTLLASAHGNAPGRVPIPHLTGGYEPLAAKYQFNPAPKFEYTPFKT